MLLLLLLNAAFAVPELPHFDAKDMTPFWQGTHPTARVLEFALTDQNAQPVTQKTLAGKISLVNFFFADCPGLCPTMMHSLQSFRDKNSDAVKGVQFFSLSVQPEKDPPPKLRNFARANRLNQSGWFLLTGSRDQIFHVGRDMFKADGSVGLKKPSFIHTRNVYLVDQALAIRGIYDTGDAKAMEGLAEDLKALH